MHRYIRRSVMLLTLAAPTALCAQDPARLAVDVRADQVQVQTFNLRWISSTDAATLVSPYVQGPVRGQITGAFSAGPSMHAITVRGTKAMIATVDSILRENDRQPATLLLRFQLIAGLELDSVPHDPTIADVDAALRGLFRFGGYKLIGQGATSVNENSQFLVTVASGTAHYEIEGSVHGVRASGGASSADLNVELLGPPSPMNGGIPERVSQLLSTGLTVNLGQTIVLGSAAGVTAGQALILTVRTELMRPQKP